MISRAALLAATALFISACATNATTEEPAAAPASAAAAAATETASQRLHRLFRESDEDNLRRNPIAAIFRGDYRYADRLGDYITDEYFAAERAAAERDLAVLDEINREAVSPTD